MSSKRLSKAVPCKEGICALTGLRGTYVASHIYPRALTRISRTGEKVIEVSLGERGVKKPATWYDDQLVIRTGEDILEGIDTRGIQQLREHSLIWSSSERAPASTSRWEVVDGGDLYVRALSAGSAEALRLFFLSVVWRAGVSRRPEFSDFQVSESVLADLRTRILAGSPGPPMDYPIFLHQLVTPGPPQNRTPLIEELPYPSASGEGHVVIQTARLYFDGLVAKVLIGEEVKGMARVPEVVLGADQLCLVSGRTYEKSRTHADLLTVRRDSFSRGFG